MRAKQSPAQQRSPIPPADFTPNTPIPFSSPSRHAARSPPDASQRHGPSHYRRRQFLPVQLGGLRATTKAQGRIGAAADDHGSGQREPGGLQRGTVVHRMLLVCLFRMFVMRVLVCVFRVLCACVCACVHAYFQREVVKKHAGNIS